MWGQLGFQDSCSPLMLHISMIHDSVMMTCLMVSMVVGYVMTFSIFSFSWNRFLSSAELLETFWVAMPAVVLFLLAVPSLQCLYLMDELFAPSLSIKILGHQWYWSYEYSDLGHKEFDSYLMPVEDSVFRLLDSDSTVFVPLHSEIRAIVTSTDVLHAWTIPSMGVKMDAVPGRLNHVMLYSTKLGSMYGQCSEMCGTLHSFMPIKVCVLTKKQFLHWLKT
uniref:Cytochrome c oxidase subunit 2 n=1 Tax=Pedicinus badii TaxID=430776 RepID=A0A7H1K1B5_9NEOP|nr:cytochrome c oxidase subunit 2 [Pedicinus badii]